MLAPKDLLDALSGHASRLFSGETPLPRTEIESQFKALLQSGFSKLDLVSREEFDSQMVVLARTRARLESLEAKVAELEARLNPSEQARSYKYGVLLLAGIQPRFQLCHLRLQALQPRTGAGQDYHLAVEFFAADQVQFAEPTLQQRLELAFDFIAGQRGVAAEQARGVAAQGVEEVFGREHGKHSGKQLVGSVSRSAYSLFHVPCARFSRIGLNGGALFLCVSRPLHGPMGGRKPATD